jgi:hypothetical protein
MAKYFVGPDEGAWNTIAYWSTSSGGSGGAGVPTLSDDVILDGVPNGGPTISSASSCKSLTALNGVSIYGTNSLSIYGDLIIDGSCNLYATGTWSILGSNALYNISCPYNTLLSNLTLNATSGSTYKLGSDLIIDFIKTLTLTIGTLDVNGYIVETGLFLSTSSSTRSIKFNSNGTSGITCTGVGTVLSISVQTGWSYLGWAVFYITDSSATTKTINTVGMQAYPADVFLTGAGVVTLTSGSAFMTLNADGHSGSINRSSTSGVYYIGAKLIFSAGTSITNPGSGITYFTLKSGFPGSVTTGYIYWGTTSPWGAVTFQGGTWYLDNDTDIGNYTLTVSAGVIRPAYNVSCFVLTISGGSVIVDNSSAIILRQTSSTTPAFNISSGLLEITYGSYITMTGIAAISGGIMRLVLNYQPWTFSCSKITLTGTVYWDSSDTTNYDSGSGSYIYYASNPTAIPTHIRHTAVASSWSSGTGNLRYNSQSIPTHVGFDVYDIASSTVRTITDTSGVFHFNWLFRSTQLMRFAISTVNAIGGLDLQNLGASTFDAGYSLNCYGHYYDGDTVYRTGGGTLNMLKSTGNTQSLPSRFYSSGSNFPWLAVNFTDGYFLLEIGTTVTNVLTVLTFANCLEIALASATMNFGRIVFSGTSNYLSSLNYGIGTLKASTSSGTVIDTTGLTTINNTIGVTFTVSGNSSQDRTVILPPASSYTTGSYAVEFQDDNGTGNLTISNNNPLVSSLTFNDGGTKTFSSIYVQSYLNWSSATNISGSNIYILGNKNYIGNPYYFLTDGVHSFNLSNIYVGNTSTQYPINLQFGSQDLSNTNLTINAGNVTILPNGNGVQKLSNVVVNSVAGASSSTVLLVNTVSSYSTANNITIKNLTVNNTGTINFDPATVLISESGATQTWELGGRTIPKVLINPGSNIKITDVTSSNTTYINEISYGDTVPSPPAVQVMFSSQSITVAGGTITYLYYPNTGILTFTLYGGGSTVNNQTINLYLNVIVPTGYTANYSCNVTVSSEASHDKGYLIIDGTTVINAVSGSNSYASSGSFSAGTHQLTIRYTKDTSITGGTDTFSGSFSVATAGFTAPTATYLQFHSGRTFTFDKFFHDATTPNYIPLTISSTQSGVRTNLVIPSNNFGTLVNGTDPAGSTTATIINCAVTSTNYIWFAGKNSIDGGNNSGWIFGKSPNSQTAVQFLL